MKLLLLGILFSSAAALFFPTSGGGGGCCCGCGTPQPASCGCGPVCPPPQPCSCPAPPPCPPPPTAICPQVQPVYIPSCSGSSCGGGYGGGCSGGSCGGGCSGGSCGGGGGGCSGSGCGGGGGGYVTSGGYATSGGNGGYATSGGGYATSGGGSGYATSGGGGGYAQAAPSSGYASSGGSYAPQPVHVVAASEPSYSQGGGGGGGTGYQQNVEAAAVQADDPNAPTPSTTSSHGSSAPLNQAFRAPQICEPAKIKYVVLRAKKLNGGPLDEVEEEVEEVERPTPLEATASPLDTKDLGEEILRGEEDTEGAAQARGATTLTDAKCNSKVLKDLVLENIAKDDSLTSKRQIHEASMRKFPDHTVDVICSTTGFTYLVSTTEHCEAQRDNVICFVYKRPL